MRQPDRPEPSVFPVLSTYGRNLRPYRQLLEVPVPSEQPQPCDELAGGGSWVPPVR